MMVKIDDNISFLHDFVSGRQSISQTLTAIQMKHAALDCIIDITTANEMHQKRANYLYLEIVPCYLFIRVFSFVHALNTEATIADSLSNW